MAHAVSASYIRSDHMSLMAVCVAAALHVAVGFGVWWLSPGHRHDLEEDAIEVTMEEPRPPPEAPRTVEQPTRPPPPPPAMRAEPQPTLQSEVASPDPLGLPPEAPESKLPTDLANTTEPVVQRTEPQQAPVQPPEPKPEPPSAVAEPRREPEPPPQPPIELAARTSEPVPPMPPAIEPTPAPLREAAPVRPAEPPAPPTPERLLENAIPPVELPPEPLTMRDFVRVLPPAPAARPSPPAQHQAPQRQAMAPPLQHSPLSPTPYQRPSTGATTFVNPAQEAAQNQAKVIYLRQMLRKFSQYLPDLRQTNEGGTVVLRFVVARDGRLVDASILQSSGVMALDKGLLESLRAASPYPPLPPEIPGNQVIFTQPIEAKR